MSARLTIANRIGNAAKEVLRKAKSFPDFDFNAHKDQTEREHIGAEPMLLALSIELALKAWFVFGYDNPDVIRSHNLMKLFDQSTFEATLEMVLREFRKRYREVKYLPSKPQK